MDHLTCDRCGRGLYHDVDVRYEVRIEIKSAYDVMEITKEDLERDFASEMEALVRQASGMSEEELQDQVYKVFSFDLCATCQREYLRDPLGRTPPRPGPET
mgnify:CR=1 FL=1